MIRTMTACLVAPALLMLAACEITPPQRTTQVIVQPGSQPTSRTAMYNYAPVPPPPPHAELVPPPPSGVGPVVWQPGHWLYTGLAEKPWTWMGGEYVSVPPGANTWVPGRWAQQSSGGWSWQAGHWA